MFFDDPTSFEQMWGDCDENEKTNIMNCIKKYHGPRFEKALEELRKKNGDDKEESD